MIVRIEFFGIVRQRAGRSSCELQTESDQLKLSDILLQLEREYPALAGDCVCNGRLCSGYVVNLDGETFVTDPGTPVSSGQSVLILSADVGG